MTLKDRTMTQSNDWNLIEELATQEQGGDQRLLAMMVRFYDLQFADLMIGFLFIGKDKLHLAKSQAEYVSAQLGKNRTPYDGPPIRKAHLNVPILIGHFNRRLVLLAQVFEEFDVPDHVREAWLSLDTSLRDLVVRTGQGARENLLDNDPSKDAGNSKK